MQSSLATAQRGESCVVRTTGLPGAGVSGTVTVTATRGKCLRTQMGRNTKRRTSSDANVFVDVPNAARVTKSGDSCRPSRLTFGAVDTAFKLPFTERTSGPGGSSACTDLRSVSQQGPQRISRQGLDSGELECFRLLSVESDVLAALEVSFQLLATVQTHQIPRPHPPQDFPHGLHLPLLIELAVWREEDNPGEEEALAHRHSAPLQMATQVSGLGLEEQNRWSNPPAKNQPDDRCGRAPRLRANGQ
ncbi:hypothetical protein EYF80_005918 [Liparis tanakae]|uniref:Uncharacterized protein n=1 Tax=Liparis tanakae TaxID=230148 RepID=A0A4Z2J2M7_9TELE|nr:hypothetical protein EYF80_005918 [Liparis tanakae]